MQAMPKWKLRDHSFPRTRVSWFQPGEISKSGPVSPPKNDKIETATGTIQLDIFKCHMAFPDPVSYSLTLLEKTLGTKVSFFVRKNMAVLVKKLMGVGGLAQISLEVAPSLTYNSRKSLVKGSKVILEGVQVYRVDSEPGRENLL